MINWQVRFRNPLFWAQVVVAIISPVLVGLGMQWEEMTTWAALGNALYQAVCNPVIMVAVIGSVWAAVTDPTTQGQGDSLQALHYKRPKRKEE